VDALRAGLKEVGYVDEGNVIIEFRWADRPDESPRLVAELVAMNVDVIFASASSLSMHCEAQGAEMFRRHGNSVWSQSNPFEVHRD